MPGDEEVQVAEWAVPIFGEEGAKDPNVAKYKTPDEFLKGHRSAVERVGKSVVIPDAKSSPEDWKVYNQKIGVPDSADGYDVKLPEKMHPNAKVTPEMDKGVKQFLKDSNLTKSQAAVLYPKFFELWSKGLEQQEAQQKEQSIKAMTELKGEWGNDFDNNASFAQKAAEKMLTPEMVAQIKDKPEWIRHFNKIGKAISEDMVKSIQSGGTGTGNSKQAAEKRIKEVQAEFLERKGALYNEQDPKHSEAVAEWKQLHKTAAGVQ